jgi:hypothetical protein
MMISSWHQPHHKGNWVSTVIPGITFVFVFLLHFGQQMKPASFTLIVPPVAFCRILSNADPSGEGPTDCFIIFSGALFS